MKKLSYFLLLSLYLFSCSDSAENDNPPFSISEDCFLYLANKEEGNLLYETTYEYSRKGRKTKIMYFPMGKSTYTYDINGELINEKTEYNKVVDTEMIIPELWEEDDLIDEVEIIETIEDVTQTPNKN